MTRNTIPLRFALLMAAAPLSSGFPQEPAAPAASPTADGALAFQELPGQRELRGVLCARPLQADHPRATALGPVQHAARVRAALAALAPYALERYVPETDEYLVRVPSGEGEAALAARLIATGGFEYVEPDWLVFPIACPNDPQLGQQWHHDANRMASCAAWDIETGDPNIVVAICDTGIRASHQDLLLHRRESYHIPSGQSESAGGPIDDINGHGTLCSGSAAANGDNGVGVAGVGWNLGHRTMRVTDSTDGSASLSNLTAAARLAADLGDRVASVSYSGGTSASVTTAGTYVRGRGALLVWAAGNDGQVLTGARDDSVILVGATNSSDTRSSFSNYGSRVDLMAPGSSIRTTSRNSDTSYSSVSGTSFACPITAGLCGLIWSRNPGLTPQEVEDILRASCDDLGAPGLDDEYGHGRVNSHRAMQLTPPPGASISFPNGQPETLAPAGGDTLRVRVVAGASAPVPSAAQLFIDAGAGFVAQSLVHLGGELYEGTFPAASCPTTVRYYVRFPLVSGVVATAPLDAPTGSFTALVADPRTLLVDALEAPSGWSVGAPGDTATTGVWQRVAPIGTAAAPSEDRTPAGTVCYVTQNGTPGGAVGEADVDGGATTLLSPLFDLSGSADPYIAYWRWYSNNAGANPNADTFVIDISNDGGATWTNVEVVGPTGPETAGGWFRHAFRVADRVAPTASVRLRFVAADLGSGSIVEAGIDDLEVFELCQSGCNSAFVNYCTATANSTGLPGELVASGTGSIAANDLVLGAIQCPPNSVGIFAMSPDQTQTSLGNGNLCLGATTLGLIVRLPARPVDLLGIATFAYDNTAPPIPQGQVSAGETWNFQFLYRDLSAGGAGFNLTNGLSLTFCP